MYTPELRRNISQGDIFDDLPYVRVRHADLVPQVKTLRGMLLSHDCEYDKGGATTVHVAVIRRITDQGARYQENIRAGEVITAYYLEAVEGVLPESFVDLRYITVVDKQLIINRANQGKWLISLTHESRLALQEQLDLFFGRPMTDED